MKRVASLYLPDWSIDRIRRAERHRAPPPERARAAQPPGAGLLALKQAGDAEQGGKACDAPKNTGWRPGARWARSDTAAAPAGDLRQVQAGYADPHPMSATRWAGDEHALARPLAGVDETTGGASACWAGETRADVEKRIARMEPHQRPPMREMGRRSEAAEHPYKRLPGDDGGKSSGWPEPGRHTDIVPVRYGGEGARPGNVQPRDPRVALAAWNAMPAIRYPGDGPYPDKLAAKERRPGSNDPGAEVKEVAAFFDTGRSTAGTVARVCRDVVTVNVAAGPVARPDADAPHDVPLVTVQKVGSRVEVAAACPAARALGAEPGMALTQVRAATPEIGVRDADPAGDAADLLALAVALARRWSPTVAVSDAPDGSGAGLFLDLSGVSHLHGGEEAMAARLVRLLARLGVAARVGIADTTGAAWALARYAAGGDARVVAMAPGAGLEALAPLPVAALRIEARGQELLRRLGIDTVAELAALPRAPLVRRFGRAVADRIDQASGRVAEPLDPVVPPEPVEVEQRFAEPLLTAEPIAHWLGELVGRLVDELARKGRGARAVVLAAGRIDAAIQAIRLGFARPTRDPAHIRRLLLRRVEEIDPGYGIERLSLHVVRADPLGAETLAGDLADGTAADLAPLVDAIVNRIGPRRLWRNAPRESDVPERSVGCTAPLDPGEQAAVRMKPDDVRRLDSRSAPHAWHPRWPRPARLLRRPEPVDHVMSDLPDGWPQRFTWRGEAHRIVRGDGPERITGEWWRHAGERDAVRDYFQVEDDAGRRFWLFRRGDAQRSETGDLSWWVHGTFA